MRICVCGTKGMSTTMLMNCNCGKSAVYCSQEKTGDDFSTSCNCESAKNVSTAAQEKQHDPHNRGTVFCTIKPGTCRCTTTGMSRTMSKNCTGEHERMYCGYLSLHHNWNTNSRNLSLMITETSTTLSRSRSTRKFFLLPLFLSPRLTGEEAAPLAPCIGLGRIELFVSHHPAVKLPHARLMLGLLPLPPPLLLLLLLLLQLQVLGQEEGDGGAVNAVGAPQRRHHQERSFPRGVPHGAVTPLRPGNLRQRCRPLPRA